MVFIMLSHFQQHQTICSTHCNASPTNFRTLSHDNCKMEEREGEGGMEGWMEGGREGGRDTIRDERF